MRNMSFFLTTTAVQNRTKTHTIRTTWNALQPGEQLQAVVRSRLTRKGEQLQILATIEITSKTNRALNTITQEEVTLEGFPAWTPEQFVTWYAKKMKCLPTTRVNFIRFTYLD